MRGRYLIKLMLACLLIAVFCGGVASIYSYFESSRLMSKELEQRHIRLLEQVRDNIDFKLVNAIHSVFTLKASSELRNYALSDGEDAYTNTQMFNRLRAHIAVFSRMGYDIDILKPGAETVITPESTMRVDQYMAERGLDPDEPLYEMLARKDNRILSVVNLQKWKVDPDAGGGDRVMLAFSVKEQGTVNVYYFITFRKSELFPQSGNDYYSIRIGGEELTSKGALPADPHSSAAKPYAANSKQLPDWQVSYLPEASPATGEAREIWVKSAVVAMITIVVGAIFAVMIAYMTYRPVRRTLSQILGDSGPEQEAMPMAKDEFGLIRNITSTIRRSNLELASELHRYREPLRSKLLRDLVTGVLSREDAVKQLNHMNMKHLIEAPVRVVLLHLTDEYGGLFIDHQTLEGLEALIGDETVVATGCEWVQIDANRQALLLFHPDDTDIHALMQQIINEAHRTYPIRMRAAIGSKADRAEDAVISYHTALRVLEQLMPMNRKQLLTEQDLDRAGGAGFYYPLDLEKNLINAAVSRNEHEVRNILASLVGRVDFDHMDRKSFHQFAYAIQSTAYRIAQQLNCSLEELFQGAAPLERLEQCRSADDLIDAFMPVFDRAFEIADAKSKSLDHLLTDSMLHFVHTRYDRDISLLDLAQHVKMSPNYISFIFKANVGQNFKDYLNSYRVKQAKLLMENGDSTVNDIAAKVGCNNTNTFIRIFKKEEGLSPGQFIARKIRQAE